MDTGNQSTDSKLFAAVIDLVRQYKRVFILLLLVSFFQSILTGSTILLIAPITEMFLENDSGSQSIVLRLLKDLGKLAGIEVTVGHLFAAFAVITLVVGVIGVLARYVVLKIKYDVLVDLLGNTMGTFLRARYAFFSSGEVGKLLNSFQKEVEKLGDTLGLLVGMIVSGAQAIIYLLIPMILFPKLTIEFLLIGTLLSMPLWFLRKWAFRFGEQSTITANQVAKVLHENLTSAKLIISCGKQETSLQKYAKELILHARAAVNFGTLTAGVNLLFVPVGSVAALIVIYRSIGDSYALPALATALFAFFRALPLVGSIVQGKANIDGFIPAFRQVEELQAKAKKLQEKRGGRSFTSLDHGIEFVDIKVVYPNGLVALDEVSFFVPSRKITALMGRSGSGKTTIADVILGLVAPDSGRVLIDGYPLDSLDIQSFRNRIGYVPQDDHLFHSTIRDNLLWGNPNATDYQLRRACELSNAIRFIDNLEEGFDFVVGDQGSRLSGGEKQRLSIARALIRSPAILILDEPTSALDIEAQSQISDALDLIAKHTTVLIIAHRPEAVKIADQVIVLADGRVQTDSLRGE